MATQTPRSMIDKLARCQKILGYTFQDISLLQTSLTLGANRRMATAGDTYVQVALVDRWYSHPDRTPGDLATIRSETLSNHNLSRVGFQRGLDACTIPSPCSHSQHMASTVEAILAAVYRDALFKDGKRRAVDWDVFEGVVARLGINHHLIASASDLRWAFYPTRTTRKIPLQFFSKGHHFELTRMLAQVSGQIRFASSQVERMGEEGTGEAETGEEETGEAMEKVRKRSQWFDFLCWFVGGGSVQKGHFRWTDFNIRVWGPRRRTKGLFLRGPHGTMISVGKMLRGDSETWARFWKQRRRNRRFAGPS